MIEKKRLGFKTKQGAFGAEEGEEWQNTPMSLNFMRVFKYIIQITKLFEGTCLIEPPAHDKRLAWAFWTSIDFIHERLPPCIMFAFPIPRR